MAETLVVVSKIKKMVKEAGLRTGGDYIEALSGRVNQLIQASVEKVKADASKKTLGAEDLKPHVPRTQTAPEAGSQIRSMFDRIASDYDRFNAWASLGLHQHWRKALVRHVPEGARLLDIATGTGDVAFLAAHSGHAVVGLDFSERMLALAKAKDKEGRVRWMNGSADKLPFSDRSFGCITSAFALRNLRGCLEAVFRENYRVLRKDGKVLHMDFGRPTSPISRWGHQMHLNIGIPLIGQWVCKEKWPKGYLETTIREFYDPKEVVRMLQNAGFEDVRHLPLSLGVVQLFEGKESALAQYGNILLFVLFGAGFAVFNLLVLSPLLRFKSNDERQKIAYECGMEPIGTPYVPMDIEFYIFGLLFVIFDVEALFLYPWAVIFRELGWNGFVSMLVFVAVLFFGLIYTLRRGALRWER